jgi:hypothetical protein
MQNLKAATFESQIANGGAWIGSPAEIIATIRQCLERMGRFEHASLQVNFGGISLEDA